MWRRVDFIQLATTSSVVKLKRSSKVLPKAKLAQKEVMVTGGLLPVWSTTAFWIPAKPLHLRNMHSKLMHQKRQCLQPALVNRLGPIFLHNNTQPHVAQPTLQKLNKLGYKVLPHPPYAPDLLPTVYNFFKHLDNFFFRENASTTSKMGENTFQEFIKSWSMDFHTTGIKKLIPSWQKCVDCNGFYFD